MDRRDHFAAAALQAIITADMGRAKPLGNDRIWAYGAKETADALIAVLDEDKPRTPVDIMADEVMVELQNILRLADAMRVAMLPLATGELFPKAALDRAAGRPILRESKRRALAQAQTKALSAIADYEAYRNGLGTNSPA